MCDCDENDEIEWDGTPRLMPAEGTIERTLFEVYQPAIEAMLKHSIFDEFTE